MSTVRKIKKVHKSIPTVEGAGVHLKRAFGFNESNELDPFLLLDDFKSDNPADYINGFPWHPHRGIETITYLFNGSVEHGDSLGNKGIISSGDVQWMTAGSGIVHQEMPKGGKDNMMWGTQLWANLPSSHKMMEPRYRDIKSSMIPEVQLDNRVRIKVICGEVKGVKGPVTDIVIDPEYLDVKIPDDVKYIHKVKKGYTVFAYVLEGGGFFGPENISDIGPGNLVIFDDGDELEITADTAPLRFLLISGKPLGEPVAWYGPIVMNTQEEIRTAFEEYNNGTFLKHK